MNFIRRLLQRWRALDPAWRFALSAYFVARIALSVWTFVIALFFPILVRNLDLFNSPTLAVFDMQSGERYAYSSVIGDVTLTFRYGDPGFVIDDQTNSVWSLRDGRAVSGTLAGQAFGTAAYSIEEIFPYHGVAPEKNQWLSVWQRFDTNWYLAIAERGYTNDGSTAFFPLYPALIRLLNPALNNPTLTALLISNLALIGSLGLLYEQTKTLGDAASARRATQYLLMIPAGFFFLTAYTESVFLFFALSAFALAHRGKWLLASLVGVLAALTRLQGLLVAIPLAYLWWREWRSSVKPLLNKIASALVLLLIPMATATFLLLSNWSFLTILESQWQAQFALPWQVGSAAFDWWASGRASWIDGVNLASVLFVGIMLVSVWRRLPREYGYFALGLFVLPLVRLSPTQPFVSAMRYLAPMFPVFIVLGGWGKNPWVNRAVVYLSFPLQLYLSAQFVLWGWVG